ncbi:Retrotrans gag domain-containing protein [Abeliophyllum distichum]|uniref:Retrotrans gag domain-containing protein n=1 Tax=Abeliophyllum distichum TaxID=126358 RepID=A0ABD1QT43_9LAMI
MKRKNAIGLTQVIQEKEETLQDYFARFSRATLEIKYLQMSTVVTTIMNRTQNQSFKMSISKNPPDSMQELLRNGDKYVDTEKAEKLKEELERLLKIDFLARYVKNDHGKVRSSESPTNLPLQVGVINVISRGMVTGGLWRSNSNSRRNHRTAVTLGTYPASITIITNFLVVKTLMAYNAIYVRTLLNATKAVVSTYHQSMKFSTSQGVGCVRRDQYVSRRCYVDSIQVRKVEHVMILDIEPLNGIIESLNTIEKIEVAEEKMLTIGGWLQYEEKEKMINPKGKSLDRPWNVEHLKK